MYGCGYVPIKLYLTKLESGCIWPKGYNLPTTNIENPKEPTEKILKLTKEFSKVTG